LQFFLKDYPYNLKTKVKLFIEFKKFLEEDDKIKKSEQQQQSPTKKNKKKIEEKQEETKNAEADFSSVGIKESDFIFVKK